MWLLVGEVFALHCIAPGNLRCKEAGEKNITQQHGFAGGARDFLPDADIAAAVHILTNEACDMHGEVRIRWISTITHT